MSMPHPKLHFLVCVNDRGEDTTRSCCAGGGGLEIYRRFKDRVRELGVKDHVLVTRTGCLRHCSRGPTVIVWPAGRWYGGVHVEDVDELVARELDGLEVVRLRMPDGPWE